MSTQLFLDSITAAWCEDGASVPRAFKLAVGLPAWQASTEVLSEIPALLDQAHQQAQAGFTVLACVPYEAAPAFDANLRVRPGTCTTRVMAYHADQLQSVDVDDLLRSLESIQEQAHGMSPWLDECTTDWFNSSFAQIRNWIEQGDFYQINLTTRLRAQLQGQGSRNLFALFLRLFEQQPAAYSVFIQQPQFTVLSLSPELFFSWDAEGKLQTRPMKGTRKPAHSSASSASLADSSKDRAENLMIVDLLRNDMARICKSRSVQVDSLFDVLKLPSVEQMTSTISGLTHEQLRLSQVFEALFPCGSVTGAPKAQAMRRIAELEPSPRGLYCGAIGVLKPDGQVRFSVPIRTVVAKPAAGALALEYGVGSGVTWYSDRRDEKREWWQKTVFLRKATVDFEILETLRLDEGGFLHLDEHLARMAASAELFSYVWNEASARDTLAHVAEQHVVTPGVQAYRVRCLLAAAGDFRVELFDLEPNPSEPVRLVLADRPIEQALQGSQAHSLGTLGRFIANKTTFRPHYEAFTARTANGEPCFDTLLYDNKGLLTETCRFNLVVDVDGHRLTPSISKADGGNLLPGVFRQKLLSENKVKEGVVKLDDLRRADGMWLINSLRGWILVGEVLSASGDVLYSSTKSAG